MRYIIVGKSPYSTFIKCYKPQNDDYLIGLDDGAFTIIDSGFKLNEAWGDFDTSTRLSELENKNIKTMKFSTEKNETDLELVLKYCKLDNEVLIYDITGGRLDHELVNFLLLKKYKHLKLKIIDEKNEIQYISSEGIYRFNRDIYNYISILTFTNAQISINKAKYHLNNVTITINDTYTTSNNFEDGIFELELISGEVILIRSI